MNNLATFFIAIVLFVPQLLQAQSLKYSYDASGNRIKREVLAVKSRIIQVEPDSIVSEVALLNTDEVSEHSNKANIGDAFPTIIYPNPTSGQLSLELPDWKSGDKGSIQIFSEMGKVIANQSYVSNRQSFDLSFAPQGFYILRITVESQVVIKKVIKQ